MNSYRQELADSLTELFSRDGAEGEAVADVLPFVDALLRRLRTVFERLLEAENRHLDELADDAQHRTRRDEAAAELRQTLIDLRFIFRMSFGFEKAEAVGFEREIAQDSAALHRQTLRLMANLVSPDLNLPSSQYEGITVTPESIAAQVEPRAAALKGALLDVTKQLSAVQGTQVTKDQALESFNGTYVLFLRILQACFRLAGKEELAKRLRRAIPRSGSTRTETEPADPPVDPPVDPPEGDSGNGDPAPSTDPPLTGAPDVGAPTGG